MKHVNLADEKSSLGQFLLLLTYTTMFSLFLISQMLEHCRYAFKRFY